MAHYETKILPILQKKCAACHRESSERPFFYDLPFLGSWTRAYVDEKIQRALLSFEILPSLTGAESEKVFQYSKAIQRVLKDERMPPPSYVMLHPQHRVTKQELLGIDEWVSSVDLTDREENAK